ncbi:MAG TPA: ribonuclease HII [Pseudomonadales bacterium]|jgi:ribonuclease HII
MGLFDDLAGTNLTAGVDEVGRGPLAGPVVAGAVVLDPLRPIDGLKDSKRLNARRRAELAEEIRAKALAWGLGRAEVEEIDALNILRASHLAMQRAVAALSVEPEMILVDGNLLPVFSVPAVAVVKGDARVPEISAGAILAKVARDREMIELDRLYPGYGFAGHKGYPTAEHLSALAELGACAVHRTSFAPVRDLKLRRPTVERLPL